MKGLGQLSGLDAQLGHAPQVDLHAQLTSGDRPALRGAHAIDRLEGVLELASIVLQLAIGRILRDERDLQDIDQAGAQLANLEACQFGRERRAQCVDFASHLVVLLVRVSASREFDGGDGYPVGHGRLDLVDVVELREPVLDRLGHQSLEVLRVGSGVDSGDQESRELQIRIFLAWHAFECEPAEHDQTQEDYDRERVATERELQKRHGPTPQPASTARVPTTLVAS